MGFKRGYCDWCGWLGSVKTDVNRTLRCVLCKTGSLHQYPEPASNGTLPIVTRQEEPVNKPIETLRRLKNNRTLRQSLTICCFCHRSQPQVHSKEGRKCICCGQTDKYKFAEIQIPMGVVYDWSEQRLERDCEVWV